MQSWNIKLITSGLRRARDLQVGGRGAQRGDGGEQGRLRQLLRAREHAGGRGGQGRHHLQGEAGGHLLLRVRGQYHTNTLGHAMHGGHLSMSSFCRSVVTVNLGNRRLRSPSVEPVLKD